MPFVLPLPPALKQAGWKVKIHDNELLETPHVTIYQKMVKRRVSLRTGEFLETHHRWSQISKQLAKLIREDATWDELIAEWNKIHGDNPV